MIYLVGTDKEWTSKLKPEQCHRLLQETPRQGLFDFCKENLNCFIFLMTFLAL